MPTYDYECCDCHFRFERKQRFHEEPVAVCSRCQGKARRVLCSVPVIFKGSGFYTTDNRKGSTTSDEGKALVETGGNKAKESSDKAKEPSAKT